jgi:hypothetical protein
MHTEAHPMAGKTVYLNDRAADPLQEQVKPGALYRVEDYWDRIAGKSWMVSKGNPAALHYALRSVAAGLPGGDNVVYGKIGAYGHLVHVSELGQEVT